MIVCVVQRGQYSGYYINTYNEHLRVGGMWVAASWQLLIALIRERPQLIMIME